MTSQACLLALALSPVAWTAEGARALSEEPEAGEAGDEDAGGEVPEGQEDEGEDEGVLVVTATSPDRSDLRARETLDEAALERASGADLAETVASVPGVVMAGGTTDGGKPIIRGHQERRLLVLVDGVRHESQKWGPDHATEVDPFSAGEISVVRGAAGVRYGTDAIGGVILVDPPTMRDAPGLDGKTLATFATNGLRPYAAARVDLVPEQAPSLSLRAEANYSRGAALSAPDYVLGNTASEVWNAGGAARLRWGDNALRLTLRHYDLRAGVFYGVSNSTPADFEANLAADRPATADLWERTYTIDRPYQAVRHDLAAAHFVRLLGSGGTLQATYAFQINRREEYEQVREAISGPQYDFTLRTHSLDTSYAWPDRALLGGTLSGGLGLQGSFQENVYRGLPLLPNYRALGGGLFAFERLARARAEWEIGLRADLLGRTAWFEDSEYDRHLRRGTLDATRCTEEGSLYACPARYHAVSATAGALVHLVPDRLDLKAELSTASRFPNVDELYLIGAAPTYPVYALGSPDLPVESTRGGSTTLGVALPWLHAEASLYGSHIQNYVYFAPELNEDGSLHYDVTIRGAWPTYAFHPVDAWMYGSDAHLELGPELPLGLDVRASLVRGLDADTGDWLVGIPPDRATVELIGRPPTPGSVGGLTLRVGVDGVARQSRVDPAADFAPAPDGYALLSAGAEATLALRRRELRLGVEAENLLNTAYREYTSLLRYYADQPGRDVRVRIALDL